MRPTVVIFYTTIRSLVLGFFFPPFGGDWTVFVQIIESSLLMKCNQWNVLEKTKTEACYIGKTERKGYRVIQATKNVHKMSVSHVL